LAHFLKLRGTEIGDDAVEGVVGDSFVVGFLHPGVESLAERLTFVLDGEIDQRGGAAESSGDGASLEIVGAGSAAEGHVEMRVDVDAAGNDEAAGGFSDVLSIFCGKLSGDGSNLVARDAHVGEGRVCGSHDRAVANYGVKAHVQVLC